MFENPGGASAFGPRGNLAVASGGVMVIWDVGTGESLTTLDEDLDSTRIILFSPGGRYLAFDLPKKSLARVLRVDDWSVVLESPHQDNIHVIAFSPDETLFAAGSADQTASLWDIESGQQVGSSMLHDEDVRDITFSCDGELLATASIDGRIRLKGGKCNGHRPAKDVFSHQPSLIELGEDACLR